MPSGHRFAAIEYTCLSCAGLFQTHATKPPLRCPPCAYAKKTEYMTNLSPARKRRNCWRRAGVSDLDLAEEIWQANTCCQICGGEKEVLDHCHTTGMPRGTLCNNCNVGLGHFKDDPCTLEAAMSYLRRSLVSPI